MNLARGAPTAMLLPSRQVLVAGARATLVLSFHHRWHEKRSGTTSPRGTNENTTGCCDSTSLKTDLSAYPQSDLDKVARRLNQRPRKNLGL